MNSFQDLHQFSLTGASDDLCKRGIQHGTLRMFLGHISLIHPTSILQALLKLVKSNIPFSENQPYPIYIAGLHSNPDKLPILT